MFFETKKLSLRWVPKSKKEKNGPKNKITKLSLRWVPKNKKEKNEPKNEITFFCRFGFEMEDSPRTGDGACIMRGLRFGDLREGIPAVGKFLFRVFTGESNGDRTDDIIDIMLKRNLWDSFARQKTEWAFGWRGPEATGKKVWAGAGGTMLENLEVQMN